MPLKAHQFLLLAHELLSTFTALSRCSICFIRHQVTDPDESDKYWKPAASDDFLLEAIKPFALLPACKPLHRSPTLASLFLLLKRRIRPSTPNHMAAMARRSTIAGGTNSALGLHVILNCTIVRHASPERYSFLRFGPLGGSCTGRRSSDRQEFGSFSFSASTSSSDQLASSYAAILPSKTARHVQSASNDASDASGGYTTTDFADDTISQRYVCSFTYYCSDTIKQACSNL